MSDYFTSVTSTSALRRPRPLYDQPEQLPPASSWGADELSTLRVVINAANTRLLPFLKNRPTSCNAFLSSDPVFMQLLDSPPTNLPYWAEVDLASDYGVSLGQFWAALAELAPDIRVYREQDKEREDDDIRSSPPDQPPTKRSRKAVEHPDMVDTTELQFGSSSPYQASSQVSSCDDAFVPSDHDSTARESKTERLLTCFLRYIMYSIPYSDWKLRYRAECRTPLAAEASMLGGWTIQAEDDGGLRWRLAMEGDEKHAYYTPSEPTECYHVLFEAKKGFQRIIDGRPTISDTWLGQMTAEALVARLVRARRYNYRRVFVIAAVIALNRDLLSGQSARIRCSKPLFHATAASYFVCFLQFEITNEYLNDIGKAEPTLTLPVTTTS
ncbi:hypothetical protein GGR58DRAFT_497823 [Xylaria digitata]|nr:hypothetical protein GGR58DRAFT_497823 [Xylaria digitata]